MEGSSSANDPKPKKPTKQPRAPSKDHVLRKRRPQKPERDASVVYVNTKTPIKAVVDRCCKLINKGEKELTLYCLGAAIQRGILIALRLCEQNVAYKIHSNTFTTELIGNWSPRFARLHCVFQTTWSPPRTMLTTPSSAGPTRL
ncbi:hypothetical protein Zmor_022719 [Zophobas morio]|uniref:DNA/RNA-binding protein Alba-like domain-containing protein n=1 Tax=Zophobas morio TaxID=2755281 RepID=A0AA38HY18_9CUCU|nr:hypothetical protein Zmor_022719 [Zophobas morio]